MASIRRPSSPSRSPTRPRVRCATASADCSAPRPPGCGAAPSTRSAPGCCAAPLPCRVGRRHSRSTTRTIRSAVIKRVMERRQHVHQAVLAAGRAVHDLRREERAGRPGRVRAPRLRSVCTAVAPVYREYEAALRGANAADFDDLLVLPVRMLADHPQELERLSSTLPVHPGGRVPGYQPGAVPSDDAARRRASATSASSATTISPSMAGAARTSGTSSTSTRIFPTPRSCGSRRTTAPMPPILELANVVISANTGAWARRCAPRAAAATA